MRLTRELSPAERDRWMQVHLAQARGAVRNGDLLRAAVGREVAQMARRTHHQGVSEEKMPINEARNASALPADPLIETRCAVADPLEGLSIPYAITGSIASSVHGEPFSSIDVDLIVLAPADKAAALSAALGSRFYAPPALLADAAKREGLANVVDNQTSLKAALSFVAGNAFLRSVLVRRVQLSIGSHPRTFWFVTAEDVILMKLLWRKDSKSANQWENALGVARVKGARMDWKCLFDQAQALDIEDDLIALRHEAGI